MTYLLLTDTHWDENPDNDYRWKAFDHVHRILDAERGAVEGVFHLGDAWDRADRFSGQFVNRLIGEIKGVGQRCPFTILRGNHDVPLRGPPFFQFLNGLIDGVQYVVSPEVIGSVVLLPFSREPATEWRSMDFDGLRAAFMHVTVTGSISESGRSLSGVDQAILPKNLRLYSGDVHNPQTIRNLTYVGCPHVIKFGDDFQPRMLLLNSKTLEIDREISIQSLRKVAVDISSPEELGAIQVNPGDRVRVRVNLVVEAVDRWGQSEREIAAWAASRGVELEGAPEAVVASEMPIGDVGYEVDPEELLREFVADDGISSELLDLGLELIREARG